MTPLTEGELSQTTAQDGTALEENQLNQLLLIGALATVAEAAKDVVPVEADVLIEGIEYKEGGEQVGVTQSEDINDLMMLIHPDVIGVNRMEFNNIRLEGNPETFGNVHVQGIQVDQQIRVSSPR